MPRSPHFIPALRFSRLTPLYDPLMRWAMREETFKRILIANADLGGRMVLDLGCGTGTLTILAMRDHPGARVFGLDPDPRVLGRASEKAGQIGLAVPWCRGLAGDLPYSAGTFDRVIISLVLHHLAAADRRRALAEVHRILRRGGEIHLADFGPPQGLAMWILAAGLRHLEHTADLLDGKLPGLLAETGFVAQVQIGQVATALGPLVLLRASKA